MICKFQSELDENYKERFSDRSFKVKFHIMEVKSHFYVRIFVAEIYIKTKKKYTFFKNTMFLTCQN